MSFSPVTLLMSSRLRVCGPGIRLSYSAQGPLSFLGGPLICHFWLEPDGKFGSFQPGGGGIMGGIGRFGGGMGGGGGRIGGGASDPESWMFPTKLGVNNGSRNMKG